MENHRQEVQMEKRKEQPCGACPMERELTYIRKLLLGVAVLVICVFVGLISLLFNAVVFTLIAAIGGIFESIYIIGLYLKFENSRMRDMKWE